jgi:DNA-binding transcriptional LysR family regulator
VNLDALRLFCDVVRLRSVSRGAQAGGVTQSAASQAIQQLEADLDATLLDRSRRPIGPTEEGRRFYEACRTLLQGLEQARADLAAARQRVEGTVRVAAIYSVGLHDMSRHLQPFMSAHPHARVSLECLHPHKVVEAVLNDDADLGVLSYPVASRALAVIPLRAEPMVLVTHPGHRLARRRAAELADLEGEPFVAFDRDLAIRRAIDRALRHHNVRVQVVMAFDNIETIKQAIAIAAGVSLLPLPTVAKEGRIRSLVAVPLRDGGLVRPIGIVHRRGRPFRPVVARFVDLLREADGVPAPRAPGPAEPFRLRGRGPFGTMSRAAMVPPRYRVGAREDADVQSRGGERR